MKIYEYESGVQTRWATFENPKGTKGGAALSNQGAKGSAFQPFCAGSTEVLMESGESGVVTRIWLTICDRSAEVLDAVKIRMYWDNQKSPAVDAPLGDFFCAPFGKLVAFESELLSNPEGRSFNCAIPMPFKTGARIELVNTSDINIKHLFYEVDYELREHKGDVMRFHADFNCADELPLGADYELMPKVEGAGKIIGVSCGVDANKAYGSLWWGEGEVKIYLDGDDEHPTLSGTGTEDYIGTGWGLGHYANTRQGSLAVNDNGVYSFYRMHTCDPIHFHKDVKMTLQPIGGGFKADLLKVDKSIAPYKIVTRDEDGKIVHLAAQDYELAEDSPEGWYNFYRLDRFRSVVYYYLMG